MAAIAYSSIDIVDLTDSQKLSAYITSNQPTVVIYDPNATAQYNPNWSTNNLILTPVIFIDNESLALTAPGVSITWERQLGSGTPTTLTTSETVSNGVLTVKSNVLSTIQGGIITYICNVQYTNPDTDIPVKTKVQMSFSLVKNATELKDCKITGEQIFSYNGEGALVSGETIVLTANLTNTSVKEWQYKTANGTWEKYPGSSATTQLTVKPADAVFTNDIAIIKCLTTDGSIFDIHQINKLRDGAAGSSTYTAVLSNESQLIPCNPDGTIYEGALNGVTTTITIYEGATNDTQNWTISHVANGITGTYNEKTFTYTVTGMSGQTGSVIFTCSKDGAANIVKKFNLTKLKSGADGQDAVYYDLSSNNTVLKLDINKNFVPSSIIFSSTKRIGDTLSPSAYAGRYKIYESTDGTSFTLKYTSGSDESSKTYSPSANTVKIIKCELYASGGATTLLDYQSVSVISDGENGKPGTAGKDAINVVLGNSSEVIPCDVNGNVAIGKDISIPYSCYQGIKRIAGSATVGQPLPSGVTLKTNTNATASSDGLIVLSFAKGANLSSALSGDITITVTASGLTSTHKFTWTKDIQAKDAISFYAFAPNGDILQNGKGSVVINTTLTSGTNTITSGVTYQWYKYIGSEYQILQGKTQSSLTVTGSMVESVASFKCVATYNGKQYSAYWCVRDMVDSIQLELFSTIGNQMVNGQGIGAIYALAFRAGEELDAIKSTVFSTTPPNSPENGDFYYKLDKANKSITLMKYIGTTWSPASGTDLPKGKYSWYRRNSKGEIIDSTTPYGTGKVIYVDSSVVNGKTVFTCKFEI